MKIKSAFTRGLISNQIRKILKKKTGYDIDIQLNDLEIVVVDGKAKAHLDADIEIGKEDLLKLLK